VARYVAVTDAATVLRKARTQGTAHLLGGVDQRTGNSRVLGVNAVERRAVHGHKHQSMPMLTTISGSKMCAAKVLCTPRRLNQSSPNVAMERPGEHQARGPLRGRIRLAVVAPKMMPPEKGKKAKPVFSAL